ncbi:hypothetical protein L7F22_029712 [Adiantum nelumboides]|nr:hypothetical protein [Adiantum nelumboides]
MERKHNSSAVTLDQIPPWNDLEVFPTLSTTESGILGGGAFADPLLCPSSSCSPSKFPCDSRLNSKLFVWHGDSWVLLVDAIVHSSNEAVNVKESSPGLHTAAGPRLAEECAVLGGCRTGMAQITGAYDLPARRVIHTVGPKYVEKYHTAAENALTRCYQACFELLIEHDLKSLAIGCIYEESKGYPREQAAHVALRTLRHCLDKHGDRISAVVLCFSAVSDLELYEKFLPYYFPRNTIEEHNALLTLPANVGDEIGETTIDERKIRIKELPVVSYADAEPSSLMSVNTFDYRTSSRLEGSLLDSSFLCMTEDPDERREQQWERAHQLHAGWMWSKWTGHSRGHIDTSFHSRFLARAKAVDLSKTAEMKIMYPGGVDHEGQQVMVVVGAHFLLRSLDLEQLLLYVVKEFEQLIKERYSIVYFHSAAALNFVPDTGWMKRIHHIMGPRHKTNLHKIYMVHPTFGLKASVLLLRLLADSQVWAKVTYVDSLSDLFRYVSQDQLTIPDFVFQHDMDLRGGSGLLEGGKLTVPRILGIMLIFV